MKEADKVERKRRGSIVDVFLILLILLSIVSIIWRYYRVSTTVSQLEKPLLLTAETEILDSGTYDCMRVGDKLYTASGELFGTLLSVEKIQAEVSLILDGEWYEGAWEEELRCKVRMEIAVNAIASERGDLVAGSRVLVGEQLPLLYSDFVAFHPLLYKISPYES